MFQLEGQPFGTRGGMAVEHVFPADGEYRFTVRNLGVGTFIPDEVLELSIDGERVHDWVYTRMGLNAGMDSEADGEHLFVQRRGESYRQEVPIEPIDTILDEIAEFTRCIRKGTTPETDGEQGLAVVEVFDAIMRSIASGAPERIT